MTNKKHSTPEDIVILECLKKLTPEDKARVIKYIAYVTGLTKPEFKKHVAFTESKEFDHRAFVDSLKEQPLIKGVL